MASPLFTGPFSLRDPRERLAFVFTLLFAFPAATLIGFVIHQSVGVSTVALFVVLAMLYVTLARGRLIGSSVMIHEAQYPRVFEIVKEICARLDIPIPLIFVREDNYVPVAALGFGEPYSLVLSSHWIEHFEDDELAFAVGRELGHIAAGHTRFLSLLSVNGNENPIIALIFGAWLRSCCSTCDRVGLLACGSLDAATRSISISSFHSFGRHIDVERFAEQGREIAADGALRFGEWLGAEPYATRRLADMRTFQSMPAYAAARTWYDREVTQEPPALTSIAGTRVTKADCAGVFRRGWAVLIDGVVLYSLLSAFTDAQGKPVLLQLSQKDLALIASHGWFGQFMGVFARFFDNSQGIFLMSIYLFVLVGLTGQSFGMMITGLRVVTTDFRAPGLWRSLWRYLISLCLWPVIIALTPFMRRLMLHDRWSGTRLIRAERVMARVAEARAR